jgi:hypothetical protein
MPGAALELLGPHLRRVRDEAAQERLTGFSTLHTIGLEAGTWRSFAPADANRTMAGIMALLVPCDSN